MTNDLTTMHMTVLTKLNNARAMTETAISRAMSCEKALTRNLVRTLIHLGLVKNYAPYEFAITSEGVELLTARGLITVDDAKKPKKTKPATIQSAVEKLSIAESKALLEKPYVDPYDMPPKEKPEPEPVAPAQQTPSSKDDEWQELIHRGLARLNEQLGYEPVKIDNLELKTFVLLELAGSLTSVSTELVWLLTEISKDLRKAGGEK